MADEGELRKRQDRGDKAENLLKNELIEEFFEQAEKDFYEMYRSCPAEDTEALQLIKIGSEQLRKFKSYFEKVIRTGKDATRELKTMRKQ